MSSPRHSIIPRSESLSKFLLKHDDRTTKHRSVRQQLEQQGRRNLGQVNGFEEHQERKKSKIDISA